MKRPTVGRLQVKHSKMIYSVYPLCTSDSESIGTVKQKKKMRKMDYFLIHQFKHMFWVLKKRLIEAVLFFSAHNICFGLEIRKT